MTQVLIIDDRKAYTQTINNALVVSGYGVVVAIVDNAEAAYEAILLHSPDWLIVDVNLTGGNTDSSGVDVAEKAIKAGFRPSQIILHSSNENVRQYWARKFGTHERAKQDVIGILRCIDGGCEHKTGRP